MRSRFAAIALTLAFGLGIVGFVSAEETGNWFTRLFTSSSAKSEKADAAKSSAKDELPPMPPTSAKRVRQAKADLERRQDVCMKLRELANANDDEETLRKVEHLEKRAYELYVAASSFRSVPLAETSVKKGGR